MQNLALVERIEELAKGLHITPGQLALAWLHAQGDDVFPIPGTKKIKYLEENAKAATIKLSQDVLQQLNELSDKVGGQCGVVRWEVQVMVLFCSHPHDQSLRGDENDKAATSS